MFCQFAFHVSKSGLELSIRTLESSLRIDFQIARDIDDDEKHVADFVLETFAANGVVIGRNHLFEFRDFFLKLIENTFDVGPIKTDTSGARRNLVCLMDGGQLTRNAFQERPLVRRAAFEFLRFFLRFDGFPILDHLIGRRSRFLAKDVRMTADQFLRDFVDHRIDIEVSGFLSKIGVEHNVEEKVTKFLGHAFKIAVFDGLQHLIDFLNQHRLQRVKVLLLVPRAAIRTAQCIHDLNEPLKFFTGAVG